MLDQPVNKSAFSEHNEGSGTLLEESRCKLGLALAGGGFRASLFHLGVLRRMAEMDLLRFVEVLSTVSGGSIIGALYTLELKVALENAPGGTLSREDYLKIMERVEVRLRRAIQKNLRTWLLLNPLGILRIVVTHRTLGQRMARLYERYLYQDVVRRIRKQAGPAQQPSSGGLRQVLRMHTAFRPGRLPLKEMRIVPAAGMPRGIEAYNREAVENGRSASTRLVLNATSLNSGARFWFSSSEIGDWYLGHVRHSEIRNLLERKALLQQDLDSLSALLSEPEEKLQEHLNRWLDRPPGHPITCSLRSVSLVLWWRGHDNALPEKWKTGSLFEARDTFQKVDMGWLRLAKNPAWYLQQGLHRDPPVKGGFKREEHLKRFWSAFDQIDHDRAAELQAQAGSEEEVTEFVLELYWLRSAEYVSEGIGRDWERLSVGDAVGASACFPPVFPPFVMMGIYDDLHVARLALTDGGVFDNLGITALRDEGCNYIIASDTSGLFKEEPTAPVGRLGLGLRVTEILNEFLGVTQRELLQEDRRVSRDHESRISSARRLLSELKDCRTDDQQVRDFKERIEESVELLSQNLDALVKLKGLVYFHIKSPLLEPPGGAPPEWCKRVDPMLIAGLRTDLDCFGDVEIAALVNHGYETADRYIRRYLEGSPYQSTNPYWGRPDGPAVKVEIGSRRLEKVLRTGRKRFFRALSLNAISSWTATVVVLAAVIYGLWGVRASVSDLIRSAGEWLAEFFSTASYGLTQKNAPLGLIVLVILGIAVGVAVFAAIRKKLVSRSPRWQSVFRSLLTAAKWARGLSGNLSWILNLPVVLALISMLGAAFSLLFFSLPFLKKTRLKGLPRRKSWWNENTGDWGKGG